MGAHPLPPGERQFFDNNGVPLAGGTVTYYIPSTTTPKDTYQNPGASITNTNPITLDSAGRAIIWGVGSYREIVKDPDGNLIWDQVTEAWTTIDDFLDIPFEFLGGSPPLSSEVMGLFVFVRSATLGPNFDTSLSGGAAPKGFCNTNPTGSFVIAVTKNGSSIGSITIATNGAFTFATNGGASVSFVAGDVLKFVAPSSTDATLANLTWTVTGTLA